jgi:hypothetical protein
MATSKARIMGRSIRILSRRGPATGCSGRIGPRLGGEAGT